MRAVHEADALEWLRENAPVKGASFVASLPDYSEFPGLSLEEWKTWFIGAAKLVLQATPDDGAAVFFQSDIKHDGQWVDKGYLVSRAADELGRAALFHKIFCRANPGIVTHGRPSYSHLIAFSKTLRLDPARSTPDVVTELGDKTWARGMGFEACMSACKFIRDQTSSRLIVNPFCGMGSVLAVANHLGLEAVGIERSRKRAEASKKLSVTSDGCSFASF